MLSRRHFVWLTGAAAGVSVARVSAQRGRGGEAPSDPLPPSIAALTSMRDRAKPITADERRARIERARQIMAAQKIDAIILAGGTSLNYFTGIRWGNSERLTAAHPQSRQPLHRHAGLRGGPNPRAARRRSDGAYRRRRLAGGRESVRPRRPGAEGSRHRDRPRSASRRPRSSSSPTASPAPHPGFM